VLASVTSGGNITTTGAVSINTAGTGTLNLGDGVISKGPGGGFSFNSGISTSFLGTGGASATTLIPLFVAFQSATAKTVIRGAASQTANLQEWQNSAGVAQSYIDSAGNVNFSNTGSFAQASTGRAFFRVNSATVVPMTLRAAASQTANLQEWQDSSGTVLGFVSAAGTVSGAVIAAGVGAGFAAGVVQVTPTNGSTIGIQVRAAGSQTADLINVRSNAGTVLTAINSTGTINFASGNTSATANTGAVALPALAVGFITMQVAGTTVKVPYYAN
jgi:hypothetical protein